jgi:hypothetical protein
VCVCDRVCARVCVNLCVRVCLYEYGDAHALVIYTHAQIHVFLLQIQKKRSGGQCST